jgi:hypothetical protein
MAKKLMNIVVLGEQRVKVNWFVIVFNNLYNRLHDLFAPTKPGTNRNNIKFKVAQVVATLALGSQPKQGLAKARAKNEAWDSHFMLPGVWESVRE